MPMRYCEPRTCKLGEQKCRTMEKVSGGIMVYVNMDCALVKSDLRYDWSQHKKHLQNPKERRR